MTKKLLVALAACSILSLSACGGDDGDNESKALSKDEFIEKADKICAGGDDEIDAAEKSFADPENPTEEEMDAAIDDILIPTLKDELEQLRDLKPPEDDEDEVDSMLDSLEKAIEDIEKDWRTGFTGQNIEDANEKATALGLEECGDDE
jgi:hypothetical protein